MFLHIIRGAEAPGLLCVSDFSWVVLVERERERERETCDIDRYHPEVASSSDHALPYDYLDLVSTRRVLAWLRGSGINSTTP